jgi:hypothetical protein
MPNRFQTAQHQLAYDFIIKRDGEYCLACFNENGIKRGPPAIKLQIDHADNNPSNWSSTNLHLLCQKHNLEMRNKPSAEHKRLIEDYSAKNECVRARENHHTPTVTAKEQVDYACGSQEMRANCIFEQRWLDFMHEWIRVNGSIPKSETINAGAAAAGCSTSTTARYLAKYSSSFGCFQESRDSAGVKIIVYRPINFKKQ